MTTRTNTNPWHMSGDALPDPQTVIAEGITFFIPATGHFFVLSIDEITHAHSWRQIGGSSPSSATQYEIDPSGLSPGSFPTWDSFWAAYIQGEGPSTIYVDSTVDVATPGAYVLREFTTITSTDGNEVKLRLHDGVTIGNPMTLNGISLESLSSTPCITFSTDEALLVMKLDLTAKLISSGTSPMIRWTTPVSLKTLVIAMVLETQLVNNGAPVLDIQGVGGPDVPTVIMYVADGAVVGNDTVTSNASATAVVQVVSITATVDAQPGYLGTGTPFTDPAVTETINLDANGFRHLNLPAPESAGEPERQADLDFYNAVTQFGADPTGVADSSPALTNEMTAVGTVNGTAYIPAGTFKTDSVVLLPNRSTTDLSSNTHLQNAQPFTHGAETNNVFHSGRYGIGYLVPPHIVQTTALTATPGIGADVVSIANHDPSAVWLYIIRQQGLDVTDADKQQIFKILDVTGVGPFLVTLDRGTGWPYINGDLVYESTDIPQDITLKGKGTIGGPGDAPWQYIEARDCEVHNVHIDQTGVIASFAGMFDIACYRAVAIDCTQLGSDYGFVFSSAESSSLIRYKASKGTTTGDVNIAITMFDCLKCSLVECDTSEGSTGVLVSSNGGTFGGNDIKIVRHVANDNSVYGMRLSLGSRIKILDGSVQRCTVGLLIDSGCSLVEIDGLDVSGCTDNPLRCNAPNTRFSRLVDVRSVNNANDLQLLADGCIIERSLLDLTARVGFGTSGWHCDAPSSYIRDSIIKLADTTVGIFAVSGVTWVSRCKFEGTLGLPAFVANGATVIFDDETDFGSLFGGLTLGATGKCNIGPVASLPTVLVGGRPGQWGYATNGRKTGEGGGAGTGVAVWQSADANWYTGSGVLVAA